MGVFCSDLQHLLIRAHLAMGMDERRGVVVCVARVCRKETRLR